MRMPRIAFRVTDVSQPFRLGSAVEVTFEVVVRLPDGQKTVTTFDRIIDARQAQSLPETGQFLRVAGWEEGEV